MSQLASFYPSPISGRGGRRQRSMYDDSPDYPNPQQVNVTRVAPSPEFIPRNPSMAQVNMPGMAAPLQMDPQTALRYQNMGIAPRGPSPQFNPDAARRSHARAADFAESAPMPVTQEGYAGRRAYINQQRDEGGLGRLDTTLYAPTPISGHTNASSTRGLHDAATAYHALLPDPKSASLWDKAAAAGASGLYAGSPTTQPSSPTATSGAAMTRPYESSPYFSPTAPAGLPKESDYVAQNKDANTEATAQRKAKFPLTVQQAKTMWDTIQAAGVDQEGYNPVPIFQNLMKEYGVHPERARGYADAFQHGAANPTETYLNPSQRNQLHVGKPQQPYAVSPRNKQSGVGGIYETPEGRIVTDENGRRVGEPLSGPSSNFTNPPPATFEEYQQNLAKASPFAVGNVLPGANAIDRGRGTDAAPITQPSNNLPAGVTDNGDGTYSAHGARYKMQGNELVLIR